MSIFISNMDKTLILELKVMEKSCEMDAALYIRLYYFSWECRCKSSLVGIGTALADLFFLQQLSPNDFFAK